MYYGLYYHRYLSYLLVVLQGLYGHLAHSVLSMSCHWALACERFVIAPLGPSGLTIWGWPSAAVDHVRRDVENTSITAVAALSNNSEILCHVVVLNHAYNRYTEIMLGSSLQNISIYPFLCRYINKYACVYTYIHTVYMYIYIYTCLLVLLWIYICVYIYMCIYTCTSICIYVFLHIYIYVYV